MSNKNIAVTSELFFNTFNNKMIEWLEKLIDIYPEDTDFKIFLDSFKLAKKANIRAPGQLFYKFVTMEYTDSIMRRDEAFIMGRAKDDLKANNSAALDVVDKLKTYWDRMTVAEKEANWQYINLLLQLNQRSMLLLAQER